MNEIFLYVSQKDIFYSLIVKNKLEFFLWIKNNCFIHEHRITESGAKTTDIITVSPDQEEKLRNHFGNDVLFY